jgi:hypothetical protein
MHIHADEQTDTNTHTQDGKTPIEYANDLVETLLGKDEEDWDDLAIADKDCRGTNVLLMCC